MLLEGALFSKIGSKFGYLSYIRANYDCQPGHHVELVTRLEILIWERYMFGGEGGGGGGGGARKPCTF